MLQLQRALSLIYPDQCVMCETHVDKRGGLCATCWRETPFISGLVCDACGVPLPGSEDERVFCDECLALKRPWESGRAVLSYRDSGRRIVLALKHADRLDLIPACSDWMARAGQKILSADSLLVPVPAHWSRLLARRYNQAAELARGLSKSADLEAEANALVRIKRTTIQDGMTVDQRFANLGNAIQPHPKAGAALSGRKVCLIDDVMTSGATLSSATEAAYAAGAERVCVLVLARVEKAP